MAVSNEKITVNITVNAPVETVWQHFTEPIHIMQWNAASPDWHCPAATIDLKVGGQFSFRMEAKDGSFGFDLSGVYTKVEDFATIEYTMADNRKVSVQFTEQDGLTTLTETFEAETVNSIELQQMGWQAILNNFKAQVEGASNH